jgi:hypothetical protein
VRDLAAAMKLPRRIVPRLPYFDVAGWFGLLFPAHRRPTASIASTASP